MENPADYIVLKRAIPDTPLPDVKGWEIVRDKPTDSDVMEVIEELERNAR